MPQMAPTLWTMFLLSSFTLVLTILCTIYFFSALTPNKKSLKTSDLKTMNWKW